MGNIDFTKPMQYKVTLKELSQQPIGEEQVWKPAQYIGPYQGKYVIADADGEYHTVYESSLRNTPVKPTAKQLYEYCVEAALIEGFGWANQEKIIELIYDHLVLNGLIKEES